MRTINYTIGKDSISPSTVQFGGFAGEDNVTTLEFRFSDDLADVIEDYGVVHYLLEVRDSSGAYDAFPVELTTVDEDEDQVQVLTFQVPDDITLLSGKVILQLSIVKLDGDNNQERKLFTYPVRLRFSSSTSGGVSGSSEYEQYHTGVVGAMVRAAAARDAAEKFAADADAAQKDALASKEAAATAEVNAKSAAAMAAAERVAAEKAAADAATAYDAADRAAASEVAAGNYANSSDLFKTMAKRYAVGGTGTVPGEDQDNAKYYCEAPNTHQAAAAACAIDASDHRTAASASSATAATSAADAEVAANRAEVAANRAEAAAAEESWIHLKTVTLDEAKHDPNEKTEDMGDTTKGLRVKVTLPANTALPNNRLAAYISLSNGRQIVVRAEGWAKDENNPTVCIYEVRPFADVWNAETAPYFKTIASVTGDVSRKHGDLVRYFKLMTNENNPLPVGTKIEFWGLE